MVVKPSLVPSSKDRTPVLVVLPRVIPLTPLTVKFPVVVKLPPESLSGESVRLLAPLNSAMSPEVPDPVRPPPVPAQFASVNRQTVSVALVSAGRLTVVLLAWTWVSSLVVKPSLVPSSKDRTPVLVVLPRVIPLTPLTVKPPPIEALLLTVNAVPAAVNVFAWFRYATFDNVPAVLILTPFSSSAPPVVLMLPAAVRAPALVTSSSLAPLFSKFRKSAALPAPLLGSLIPR